ncbi:Protein of unknown function, partial [Cotesia congregata]
LRDNAYKTAQKIQSSQNIAYFKLLRNQVVSELRKSKKLYYETNIDLNKGDSKNMWKTLKKLIGEKKSNKTQVWEVKVGNEIITDGQQISNSMNNYFISSIENIIQLRDNAYKTAQKIQSSQNIAYFKLLRNQVVSELRKSKKLYYETNIDLNKGDSKNMWKTLKKLIGEKKSNKTQVWEVKVGNEIITDGQQISNSMNNYFISSIENIIQ